jgi:F-box-like
MIAELNHAGMVLPRVTIESLPDDVLLEIFYVYKESEDYQFDDPSSWHDCWPRLVHVCRRWRFLIFASPHHLDLQLVCTQARPVREMLDIWPAFPLVLLYKYMPNPSKEDFDNFVAALERRDRVHKIRVEFVPGFVWEQVTKVAQEPFPALTTLELQQSEFDGGLTSGDIFLNGSAPNLQYLYLFGFSIPRRLGSATHLRYLHLENIPNYGYIPPETMAISLSALPQLETLIVKFQSHTKQGNRSVPPHTRFVLPALTSFDFTGVSEYLKVLTARIDAPLLMLFSVTFFHQPVFDIPQIIRFVGHQDAFRPSSLTLDFHVLYVSIHSSAQMSYPARRFFWTQDLLCKGLHWQVLFISQICSQILSFRSSVEALEIGGTSHSHSSPEDEIDPTLWIQLFHPFTSVQSLEISEPLIAAVLPPLIGQPTADVLPSLHTLSILGDTDMSDDTAQKIVQSFVATRQQSGRPVTVSRRREST